MNRLQQTDDGGYLLAGSSNSPIGGDKSEAPKGGTDFWIVKIDALGNKLWDKTIGANSGPSQVALSLTPDGGSIVGATFTQV